MNIMNTTANMRWHDVWRIIKKKKTFVLRVQSYILDFVFMS